MARLSFLLLFLACCLPLSAATSFSIITATAAENQLHYVIVGDGFNEANQAGFLVVATNVAQALTNGSYNNWIRTNNNRINVTVVLTNSTQNGVTASAPNSDTPLGGHITGANSARVDGTKLGTIMSDVGFGDFTTYKRFVILNRGDFSGTTLSYRTVITTNAEIQIAVHESAHLWTTIGDEYSGGVFGGEGYVNNASTLTDATNQWLNTFPTLGSPVSVDGAYVPTSTCKMGALANPFCVVCSNQFVVTIGWTNVAAAQPALSVPRINVGILQLR